MTQAFGVNHSIGVGTESTYATAVATTPVAFQSITVGQSIEPESPATITGSREPVTPFLSRKSVAGDIVVPAEATSADTWLTLAGIDGGIAAILPSFTLNRDYTDIAIAHDFTGCKVGTFAINASTQGELVFNIGVVGSKEESIASGGAPSPLTLDPWLMSDGQVTIAGSINCGITELNIEVNNNLDEDGFTICYAVAEEDRGNRSSLPEGIANVTGTMTLIFEDEVEYQKAASFTTSSVKLEFLHVGVGEKNLVIDLPNVKYGKGAIEVSTPAGVVVTIPFEAFAVGATSAIDAEVTTNV